MAEKENIPLVKKHRFSLSLKSRFKNATSVELEELSKLRCHKTIPIAHIGQRRILLIGSMVISFQHIS